MFAPEAEAGTDDRADLAALAELLRHATRRSDVLGRIGPREFAIVAPDTPPEGARTLADRLRAGRSTGNGSNGRGGRAGVCAIADLKGSRVDPLDLIVQATIASREPSDTLN